MTEAIVEQPETDLSPKWVWDKLSRKWNKAADGKPTRTAFGDKKYIFNPFVSEMAYRLKLVSAYFAWHLLLAAGNGRRIPISQFDTMILDRFKGKRPALKKRGRPYKHQSSATTRLPICARTLQRLKESGTNIFWIFDREWIIPCSRHVVWGTLFDKCYPEGLPYTPKLKEVKAWMWELQGTKQEMEAICLQHAVTKTTRIDKSTATICRKLGIKSLSSFYRLRKNDAFQAIWKNKYTRIDSLNTLDKGIKGVTQCRWDIPLTPVDDWKEDVTERVSGYRIDPAYTPRKPIFLDTVDGSAVVAALQSTNRYTNSQHKQIFGNGVKKRKLKLRDHLAKQGSKISVDKLRNEQTTNSSSRCSSRQRLFSFSYEEKQTILKSQTGQVSRAFSPYSEEPNEEIILPEHWVVNSQNRKRLSPIFDSDKTKPCIWADNSYIKWLEGRTGTQGHVPVQAL